jgi:hypothetical protein
MGKAEEKTTRISGACFGRESISEKNLGSPMSYI